MDSTVQTIAPTVVLARLGVATLAGALIGINRNLHGKPAGLRTHGLVGLGAALITPVAAEISNADPSSLSRVIQGVITGSASSAPAPLWGLPGRRW